MKNILNVYRQLPRFNCNAPSAVTIGNFDGVHLGHQAILSQLAQHARPHHWRPTVITFDPHPRAYFARRAQRPELVPTQIYGLRDKLSALHHHGVEQVVLQKFRQTLADMSPQDFIENLLVKGLNTRWLLVGEDFRFGSKRSGDIHMLRQAGQRHGFQVETVTDIADPQGQRISSSEVRTALAVGNLQRACNLLGQPFCVTGHVIHGQKLGRQIGYPTLNLKVPANFALRSGIYVVRVRGLSHNVLPGIASLGVRPTVTESGRLLLEVHILDQRVDAYGKLAAVEFLHYLRDEEKFPDLPTMIAAIDNDAQGARDYFATHGLQKDPQPA